MAAGSSVGGGIWSEAGGQGLTLVALNGEQAAGEAVGDVYSGISSPLISDTGQTAFFSGVTGPSVPPLTFRYGVWRSTSGVGTARVVRSGMQAPDLAAGVTFREPAFMFPNPIELPAYIDTLVMNRSGQVNLFASVEASGPLVNDTGFWSDLGQGNLALRILRGDPAPSVGVFSSLSVLSEPGPVMSDDGSVAFLASMSGSDGSSVGIWRDVSGGDRSLIARTGDEPPGLAAGVVYNRLRSPKTSPGGRLVFESELAGPGISDQTEVAIWAEGDAGVELVVQTGDQVPGEPNRSFLEAAEPVINSAGKVAFNTRVFTNEFNSFSSYGIWSKELGEPVQPVAEEFDQAPGLASTILFREFGTPMVNAAGQVAFTAEASDSPFGTGHRTGIWAENVDGQLTLIAAEGESLDVDDDPLVEDLRTISSLQIADTSFGQRTPFNDTGQLAFRANFTDGTSGIFVSNLAAPIDLPGDFNLDGTVDAADYTVWRDGLGTTFTPGDYDVWVANFGRTAPASSTAVPEPTAAFLSLFAIAARQQRKRN